MAEETKSEIKTLSALTILKLMNKANPQNALKLTDFSLYRKVGYEEFFVAIDSLVVTPLQRLLLDNLKEEMMVLISNEQKMHFHTDKLYELFILKLCEVLHETH